MKRADRQSANALLQIAIPRSVHRALKLYALEQDASMSVIASRMIEQALRDLHRLPPAEQGNSEAVRGAQ